MQKCAILARIRYCVLFVQVGQLKITRLHFTLMSRLDYYGMAVLSECIP